MISLLEEAFAGVDATGPGGHNLMTSSNVLHVIPAVAPRYGGPSVAVIGMCRALRNAGLSTLVATTDADGKSRLDVAEGEIQDYEGVPIDLFPAPGERSLQVLPSAGVVAPPEHSHASTSRTSTRCSRTRRSPPRAPA